MPGTAQLRPHTIHTSKLKSQFPKGSPNRVASLGRQTSHCVITATAKKFSSFQEMISQSDVVLVDFYATWCGPCQMMGQIMSEVQRNTNNVTFTKVNTEKYPKIASQYNVQALPTLVLFKNGKPIRRIEGVLNASDLKRWIEQAVQTSKTA
ncbi:hypothetical protein Ndes2526A_g09288 [Nannochloris sp. 'desiccata']